MSIGTGLLSVFYPSLATAGVALVGIAVRKIEQLLHVQQDAAANAAIQAAVANFAGKVVADIHAGKLTMEDVRNGSALSKLVQYVYETVADSAGRTGVSEATLQTMLTGKVAAIAVPPVPAASSAEWGKFLELKAHER